MFYVGIDPSSTNTGLVILGDGVEKYILISPNKAKDFDGRVVDILKELKAIFDAYKGFDIKVAMEAPSFMSKGKVSQLAMLSGAIYYFLLVNDIPVELVTPSRLKKFATGNGRATKEDMFQSAPPEVRATVSSKYKKVDDVIDAYFLAKYAEKH
jgi:Holliday junction resolvasome RuvABC endonuclease subunit